MRRHRRLVLMDRLIPFLAAFVGLIALAGAVLVQANTGTRTQRVSDEITALRAEVDALIARAETLSTASDEQAAAANNGTVEALLALQDRMNTLETEWAERPVTTTASTGEGNAAFVSADGAEIDPSWPTENCIPIGTRFMASSGDELAICESPVVIRVSAVTGDNVMLDGPGVINETGSKPIPGSNCSITVFLADAEGFAELRVSCN